MAEFFLELFSEEIPAKLQRNLREKMLEEFRNFFSSKSINSKKNFSLSTPNRMIIVFEGLDKQIKISSEEISCLLYTSPSPRDLSTSRMPSSA